MIISYRGRKSAHKWNFDFPLPPLLYDLLEPYFSYLLMTYLRHDLHLLRDCHDLRIDRSILWIHRTSYLLMTYLRHDLLYYLLNLISLTCNELFSLRGHHDVGINRSIHPLYPPHLRSTAYDEFSHLPVSIATSL